MRRVALTLALALLVAACSSGTSTTTEPETTQPANPDDPTAPSSVALAANEGFLAIPVGFADCGVSVLTSGWPTTTAFNPETDLACLNEAIDSRLPSQYAYWGRDESGGISGVIIRVNESSPLTFVDYAVDASGNVESTVYTCVDLETDVARPPICVNPEETGGESSGSSDSTPSDQRSDGRRQSDRSGSPPGTTRGG
jgi:hypothetical protein